MSGNQPLTINFAQGLDTKTDPKQVAPGKMLLLQNTVFDEGGLLKKRNGFEELITSVNASYLTTLNGNLTAIGNSITAYSAGNSQLVNKGTIQPMEVSTLPLIRNSINQIQCDSVVAGNGLACVVYSEENNSAIAYKYAVIDSNTGQNIVSPTLIPVSSGVVTGSPRAFLLGSYFIVAFTNIISGAAHLQYISISCADPTIITINADLAAAYVSSSTLSWDGVVVNDNLYVAYNVTAGGQAIKYTYLSQAQASQGGAPVTAHTFSGSIATIVSLCADTTTSNPQIYISFYDSAGSTGYTASIATNLAVVFTPQEIITTGTILNLASAAHNGVCTIFSEFSNTYSYGSSIHSNYINGITVSSIGTVGGQYVVVRSVGLASKAFIVNSVVYFLSTYSSQFQPIYFLINGSTSVQASPQVVAKIAYQNGGGYLAIGLPSVTVIGNEALIPYLYKDFIAAESTANATPVAGLVLGVYSQTGINLGSFTIGTQNIDTAETAGNLAISGGFLWSYDGYYPVEHNFFLYPDNIEATATATTGGSLAAQVYFYAVTYEWEDNQGNVYRSAGSIEIEKDISTSMTATNTITLDIPTLRLTYKIPNPAKIVIYRWSTAQQIFYRVTSLTNVNLNSTTSDSISYVDTASDASIAGNDILYTTGGVVEDVNAPATNIMTLFDDRLWLVDAEDQNLLWFSKQVIESTPVEMSDLFTFFVAPTTAAQGSTGVITALAPMDDKLIIFKKNAIYYINGTGPDNTGANNGYSQPIFVTSTVGCSNQQSIVVMTDGLMFQSSKGIWLLSRSDLLTRYIGDSVEAFNQYKVQSALNVPLTNEIRYTLSNGVTLMYDYYYQQWGTFVGIPGISSCVYNDLHTYLNSYGQIYQENPGSYVDGSNPVLIALTTSWLKLAGISGYQRIREFQLLGDYLSPHFISVYVAYDYGAPIQHSMIDPTNFTGLFGSDDTYGQTSPYGGSVSLEQWRVQTQTQKCQAFQISLYEIYDASLGVPPGAGFNLSGITCEIGVKKGFRPIKGSNSVG